MTSHIALRTGEVVILDDDDFERLRVYSWSRKVSKYTTYARTRINGKTTPIQNLIMLPGPGLMVDHKNRNGLDNRKENLEIVTFQDNMKNRRPYGRTCKYRGVRKHHNKWHAQLTTNGRSKFLGLYDTPELAVSAVNKALKERDGDRAILNDLVG